MKNKEKVKVFTCHSCEGRYSRVLPPGKSSLYFLELSDFRVKIRLLLSYGILGRFPPSRE